MADVSEGAAGPGGTIVLGGDLPVPRLGFGAMRLCGPGVWGEPGDPTLAARVLARVLDLGIGLIDTSNAYGPEVNERQIADALHPYPAGLVIATKGGLVRPRREAWERDGRPARLRAACEASLQRLRVERIDLYQLHAPDPRLPLEDQVGVLADLRAEGKIRHVGLSNVSVAELRRARAVVPIVSVQNRFNLADRSSDNVLAECERVGIAFLPWYPLGGTGNGVGAGAEESDGARGRALEAAARARAVTPAQMALAWLLARSKVMLPIPGTASIAHLEENVAAAGLTLTPEELRALA